MFFFVQKGFCPCCEKETIFLAKNSWLRDNLLCTNCNCIPRERAITKVLTQKFPNFEQLAIHESSPCNRGLSLKLKQYCKNYCATQFYPNKKTGDIIDGFRNENLECQTFPDESFDIVVTQDVMEHIYNPAKAFQEIARTLKHGGAHIFTVPLINKTNPTEIWATKNENGTPNFIHTPEYHGNPIDSCGSPVTMHWGYDIVDFIQKHSGLKTYIINEYDLYHGICGEYRDVCISVKE